MPRIRTDTRLDTVKIIEKIPGAIRVVGQSLSDKYYYYNLSGTDIYIRVKLDGRFDFVKFSKYRGNYPQIIGLDIALSSARKDTAKGLVFYLDLIE